MDLNKLITKRIKQYALDGDVDLLDKYGFLFNMIANDYVEAIKKSLDNPDKEDRARIKAQILDTERMLELVGDHPLMSESLKNKINNLKEELNLEETKALIIADVVKSLPNDEEVKAHIDKLPYYGTCTSEYNEGFEDGVKWLKEQLAK
jgi:valyl-tRNA synthetase